MEKEAKKIPFNDYPFVVAREKKLNVESFKRYSAGPVIEKANGCAPSLT